MTETNNKDGVKKLSSNLFPVVGVGASAGGLEAFKRLIKAIPEDSGTAFILVQHLEPTHESILTELLQKFTNIPILEITNNVRVEPNHIYIIPSNRVLTANDGVLQLSPRPPRNQKNMPIDIFFSSLAEVHQSHAIGVVLSGTATDGTLGLKAIKDHGGITFAQEQKSAAFEAMPQSAIDAKVVDFILKPEEIPLQIISLNPVTKEGDAGDMQKNREEIFRQLLSLVRSRHGTDFTYYKQTTIRRRIMRRMGLNKLNDISAYLSFAKDNIPEQDLLYQDLLIPVTEFYRDTNTYDTLKARIFPLLFNNREYSNPIRIWIAGCSTGEEPYSVAMSLHEFLGEKIVDARIQIFATDVSEGSVAKARVGLYSKREVSSLSAERLKKYFTSISGGFQVNKFIRDMCVFACHNFLKDPPFAKMDLVSCRNVLIYMEPFLQKRALTTFHYALKEGGFLLLGRSETTGPAVELFTPFVKAEKFYTRKSVRANFFHFVGNQGEGVPKGRASSVAVEAGREDFQKNADDVVLLRYGPPGVVVNEQLEIVQFRGSTGTWLESSPGKPSTSVIKMAREGLAFELRNILHKVKAGNKALIKEDIAIQIMGSQRLVTIEVIPLVKTAEPHYLILFKDRVAAGQTAEGSQKTVASVAADAENNHEAGYIRRLENELTQLREDMRNITDDQEAVNEELQSANEELLSGSEELQSLNEELETSKEEIQSTNEELTTLNHELFDRNEQLNLSRIYAESIVATIREPLIILDRDMHVKSANRAYYDKFNAAEEETEGILFHEIGSGQWDIPALRTVLQGVLKDERKITDLEIRQTLVPLGERVMLVNASPIFRRDNAEQLILLAIEDITEARKAATDQQIFTRELESQVEERTRALQEVNISLKYSNEQLAQFATIASHDLQEPLRKIRTFANLLNLRHSGEISLVAKGLLEKINVSAERMADLIRDILNFSKVTDFRKAFEKTDLDEILRNAIKDLDLLILQKGAIVHHDRLPVIDAIPLQINQLFSNLLGNALKFTKSGRPPVIDISCRSLSPEEIMQFPGLALEVSFVEIIFGDNGIGFDPQFSAQLFKIFQRLNSRDDFEGTGIGLALCKRIVINHHGEIHAKAIEGEGAQFHIILPLEQKK